jgi:cell division protein FtsI (penicillin-binding protein 3)
VAAASISLSDSRQRLNVLEAFLFIWIAVICGRLFLIQVVHYSEWEQRAQRQQQRTIETSPQRGVIYDRNGNELAMSILVDSIFAVPSEIRDHATAATLLASVLDADEKEIVTKLDTPKNKNFCWVARKVNSETSDRILRLGIKGIYAQKEPKRFYPKRELAAQVIGYVGTDDAGLGGIENMYDDDLRGHSGKLSITRDARGSRLARTETKPEPGANVVLTIDEKIQYIAEREIDRAMEETKAAGATIVVQNPKTGEILALANRPTFNPNTFNTVTDPRALKDHAVSDVFEPGSMFKTVTLSAALEEKVVTPQDKVDASQGYIVVGGARMRDAHHMGVLTVAEVLAHSSNVGAIKIGMKLGDDKLYKYIRAYGFGQPTGIELPGETRGLVKPVKNWSKTSIGAMSIGQEIGVTPIQVTAEISSIANDGVYVAPHIVAGVTPPNGGAQQIVFHPTNSKRVISTLTAAQMKQMMEGVVLFGTGRKAILDGYTSAGKTGTAQKVDPNTGRYSANKYVGSFTGFAPVSNPAVTVTVIIDSAQGLHQGGQVSAPVWARVAQQVLEYMNVPHDLEPKAAQRQLLLAKTADKDLEEEADDHIGETMDFSSINNAQPAMPPVAQASIQRTSGTKSEQKARLTTAAATKIQEVVTAKALAAPVPQAPAPVETTSEGVVVNLPGATVPTFIGKSLRSAVETAQQAGVQIEARGSGIAREQSPPPGSRIGPGMKVIVKFAR